MQRFLTLRTRYPSKTIVNVTDLMAKFTKYFYHKIKVIAGQVILRLHGGYMRDFHKSSNYGSQHLAVTRKRINTFIPQFKFFTCGMYPTLRPGT